MSDLLLPTLLLPGFPKCGTTSVAETLSGHPDVTVARPHRATHYFTPRLYDPAAELAPLETYAESFAGSSTAVRLDDTVIWVYGGRELAELVRETLDRPKILIMLREPASRTESYLTWKKRNVQIDQDTSLADYVARCEELGPRSVVERDLNAWSGLFGSEYGRYLPGWIEAFGDDLKIAFTDDLKNRPDDFYRALAAWLGIDAGHFADDDAVVVANRAAEVRSPGLERVVRAIGRRVQFLARHLPRLYRALRGIATRLNVRPSSGGGTGADPTMATLRERFSSGLPEVADLVRGRTLLDLPAWLADPRRA